MYCNYLSSMPHFFSTNTRFLFDFSYIKTILIQLSLPFTDGFFRCCEVLNEFDRGPCSIDKTSSNTVTWPLVALPGLDLGHLRAGDDDSGVDLASSCDLIIHPHDITSSACGIRDTRFPFLVAFWSIGFVSQVIACFNFKTWYVIWLNIHFWSMYVYCKVLCVAKI